MNLLAIPRGAPPDPDDTEDLLVLIKGKIIEECPCPLKRYGARGW